MVEAINRYESPVMNMLAEGMEVKAEVDSRNCKLAADSFYMNIEEGNLAAALRRAAPFLGLIYLADSKRSFLGFGHIDFSSLCGIIIVLGGVFTVSNLGRYNIDAFTPIMIPPEPAILDVGRAREVPVVESGAIVIRQ